MTDPDAQRTRATPRTRCARCTEPGICTPVPHRLHHRRPFKDLPVCEECVRELYDNYRLDDMDDDTRQDYAVEGFHARTLIGLVI